MLKRRQKIFEMAGVKINGNGGVSKRVARRGGAEIEYTLTRKNVKNINMRVDRDGNVKVSASNRVSGRYIDDFVLRHGDFIRESKERWAQRARHDMIPCGYADGSVFSLLGRDLTLRIIQKTDKKEGVELRGREVFLFVKDAQDVHRREYLFNKWLREEQKSIFTETCRRIYPVFQPLGIPFPEIQVRSMKAKWGICRPIAGRITFNSRLAMAPQACIDYVAAHEFVHFIHADHSKNFYAVLEKIMPDWKKRRIFLNENY